MRRREMVLYCCKGVITLTAIEDEVQKRIEERRLRNLIVKRKLSQWDSRQKFITGKSRSTHSKTLAELELTRVNSNSNSENDEKKANTDPGGNN